VEQDISEYFSELHYFLWSQDQLIFLEHLLELVLHQLEQLLDPIAFLLLSKILSSMRNSSKLKIKKKVKCKKKDNSL
jgi:hypothetical protein